MITPDLLGIMCLFGGFLFLPQYLQLVLGLSPFDAGLWTVPWALAFVVGSMATPPLAQIVRPAVLMPLGLALSAVGYWMITGFGSTTGFVPFALASVIFSLGTSPVFTLTTDLIIGAAPPERAGSIGHFRNERGVRRCPWHCAIRQHWRGGVSQRHVGRDSA